MSDLVAEKRGEILAIPSVVDINAVRHPAPAILLRVQAGTNPTGIQTAARMILGFPVTVVEERGQTRS